MGWRKWFSGSSDSPEKRVIESVSQIGAEIESLIRTIEKEDEKLMRYEEKIKNEGMEGAGANQAEQKVTDILIYFQNHVQKIEEHLERSKLALEEVDVNEELRRKAEHNLELARQILQYLEKEVEEVETNVKAAEQSEGQKELNELEEIEARDEKVLERIRKMFEGKEQYRDNPDYGWIPLS